VRRPVHREALFFGTLPRRLRRTSVAALNSGSVPP
jgi:hypothetical protein